MSWFWYEVPESGVWDRGSGHYIMVSSVMVTVSGAWCMVQDLQVSGV